MNRSRPVTRRTESFCVPWEDVFGYVQAVAHDGILYVSGQLSHDLRGALVAPAPLDTSGRPSSFANMEAQIRRTYENAMGLLARFGASLDDVIEETLYVVDMDSAFHVAARVRKQMYGSERPRVANTIVAVSRLALPEQLVQISFRAVLPREAPNGEMHPSRMSGDERVAPKQPRAAAAARSRQSPSARPLAN